MYYDRRPYVMSSRVTAMRWLGFLQLMIGILVLLLGVAMTSIDLHENNHNTDWDALTGGHNLTAEQLQEMQEAFQDSRDLVSRPFANPWASMFVMFFAVPVVAVAVGTGTAASVLTRYQDVSYNMPARHLLLVLSTVNAMLSLMFCLFAGKVIFNLVDADYFSNNYSSTVKAIVALMIAIEVLIFFNMVVAFICVVVTSMWNPPMTTSEYPSIDRFDRDRSAVIIEEKPYQSRHNYSDPGYHSRYRTQPGLKYY